MDIQSKSPPLVSVIIPTFNRSDMLRQAVTAACKQTLPRDQYEIIVVDNASTDDTRDVVGKLRSSTQTSITYVHESRPGLHWARHAGASAAQGKILAFIDDDCLPEPDWLASLSQAYDEFQPDAAGGKILIRWDSPPPTWVITYEAVLGRLDLGPQPRFLKEDEFINGGNFSILRDRLFEIGGFNPDQIGSYLIGDGETGLCRKIHAAGWKMLWVPSAMVWHQQIQGRNDTLPDLKRRFANNGVADVYNDLNHNMPSRYRLFRLWQWRLRKHWPMWFRAWKLRGQTNPKELQLQMDAAKTQAEAKYLLRVLSSKSFRQLVLKENWLDE